MKPDMGLLESEAQCYQSRNWGLRGEFVRMNVLKMKRTVVKMLPKRLSFLYFFNPKDIIKVLLFLVRPRARVSFCQKLGIIRRLYAISLAVECRHAENEIISFMETVLSLPEQVRGCIVEAGCYRGGSTAKFSIAARLANRELVVFDSLEGLPEHDEPPDEDVFGSHVHPPGSFYASLDEVTRNVDRYGELRVCEFIKGWFGTFNE